MEVPEHVVGKAPTQACGASPCSIEQLGIAPVVRLCAVGSFPLETAARRHVLEGILSGGQVHFNSSTTLAWPGAYNARVAWKTL